MFIPVPDSSQPARSTRPELPAKSEWDNAESSLLCTMLGSGCFLCWTVTGLVFGIHVLWIGTLLGSGA